MKNCNIRVIAGGKARDSFLKEAQKMMQEHENNIVLENDFHIGSDVVKWPNPSIDRNISRTIITSYAWHSFRDQIQDARDKNRSAADQVRLLYRAYISEMLFAVLDACFQEIEFLGFNVYDALDSDGEAWGNVDSHIGRIAELMEHELFCATPGEVLRIFNEDYKDYPTQNELYEMDEQEKTQKGQE